MGFLRKLCSAFSGPAQKTTTMRAYYIECGKCGKMFKIGVNMSSEPVNTYADGGPSAAAYTLRKVAQDNHCFTPIEINITYDRTLNEIERKIEGGKFITEDEYNAGR